MNIFLIEYDFHSNAHSYMDKHVVKMPLEYAQMLSTANRVSGLDEGYKIAHLNHPCTVWVRQSLSNWKVLRLLALDVCEEYTYRYCRRHKCQDVILNLSKPNIPDIGVTDLPMCMPEYCKVGGIVESYREYYTKEKQHIATWKYREVPEWYKIEPGNTI